VKSSKEGKQRKQRWKNAMRATRNQRQN